MEVGGWKLEVGGWKLEVGFRVNGERSEKGGEMAIKHYRDIEAYQRAKKLVVPMHHLAAALPVQERFDLCDQMRRASKSVVANIVEGYGYEATPGKAKQFWRIAMASANEMIEHLETAVSLGYVPPEVCQPHIDEYTIVAKQLNKLIQHWRKY